MSSLRDEAASALFALQFLTRIPIPGRLAFSPAREHGAVKYYAWVGALIGGIAALVLWLSLQIFPPIVAVVLSLAATLAITGAFHEDGLADTFDGIGGGRDPQKILEIMRDSRIGTYGACALFIVLTLKVAALTLLSATDVGFVTACLVGHCWSRGSSVLVIATSCYVRGDGLAKPTARGISVGGLGMTLLIMLGVGAAGYALLGGWAMAAALMGLLLGHVASRLVFESKLKGYTGDCLGATQQLSEVCIYLALLMIWR